MPLVLEETQKDLPQFVVSHLSVTFLILEAGSFNVNQARRERLVMSLGGVQMNLDDEKSQRLFGSLRMTTPTWP
jgi:hypothetical protein